MKIILLFSILFSYNWASAQWIQQPSGTVNILRDVEMINENTGWICGDGGTILKTTNSGENWINIPNPASGKPLFDIDYINDTTMYCVGWFETILKSTNAGNTWNSIRNGPSGQGGGYYDCSFINSQTGWICSYQQKIMKTTNGGQSFDSIYIFTPHLFSIYFKNPFEGLVTGEGDVVKRTTDGGSTWYQSNINLPTNWPGFEDFCFINQDTGIMPARDGRIFKTTDFGNNWDTISTIHFTNEDLRTVDFVNQNTGFVGGTTALLFSTTNGGYDWRRENIGFLTIRRLRFVNDTTGWIVGTQGKIFKTTTGGDPIVHIINYTIEIPEGFKLKQNYPNPFNPTTKIRFDIREKSNVKLTVFDILGRESGILVHEILSPGGYEFNFNGTGLPSGVYYYRLEAGEYRETKRMVLVK